MNIDFPLKILFVNPLVCNVGIWINYTYFFLKSNMET